MRTSETGLIASCVCVCFSICAALQKMETWRVPFEMAEVGSTTDRPRFIVRLSEFSEPTSAHKLTIASDILLRESYVAADVYACVCGPVLVTRCGFRIVEACLLCSTTVEIAQVTCLAGTNQFVGSRRLRNIYIPYNMTGTPTRPGRTSCATTTARSTSPTTTSTLVTSSTKVRIYILSSHTISYPVLRILHSPPRLVFQYY